MNFWHTAMVTKAQRPNERNHIQTKLAMGQGPTPLHFRARGLMIPGAGARLAAPYGQVQTISPIQPRDRTMGMVGHVGGGPAG
jgi:hypothetical protein